MKRTRYKSSLSFDRADVALSMNLMDAGIQMGRPAVSAAEKQGLIDTLKGAESFGGWGNGNNANQFYPMINSAADVVPKPEDYIEVPFRLLTATIVGAWSWKATDFSNAKILKGSMDKLPTKPVYRNHDLEVDNFVGHIQSVSWEAASDQNGIVVPAGINGILALDSKVDPKLCRGVLSGAIYSNSVTVEFDWEMSHTFEDEWDFLNKVGTLGSDGKMIRRIVKNIYNYHETSLVFLGADPFAKLLDADGNLRNIDTASISYSKDNVFSFDKLSADEQAKYKAEHKMSVNSCLDKGIVALSKSKFETNPNNPINNPENKEDMKELFTFLAAKFGVAVEKITAENYMSYVNKLNVADENVGVFQKKAGLLDSMLTLSVVNLTDATETKLSLVGEAAAVELPEKTTENYVLVDKVALTTLQQTVKDNATTVAGLTKDAEVGKSFITMQRNEGVRLYKLTMGEKFSPAVVKLIEEAEGETLEGLVGQYCKGVAAKFAATCQDCHSKNVSFKSSVTTEEGKEGIELDKPVVAPTKTVTDIYNEYNTSPMSIRKN